MLSGFVHEWCGLLMSWFSGSGISLFGGGVGVRWAVRLQLMGLFACNEDVEDPCLRACSFPASRLLFPALFSTGSCKAATTTLHGGE
jgi:hypothetical protein